MSDIVSIVGSIVFWIILIGLIIVGKKLRKKRMRKKGMTEEEIKVELNDIKKRNRKNTLLECLCCVVPMIIISLIFTFLMII